MSNLSLKEKPIANHTEGESSNTNGSQKQVKLPAVVSIRDFAAKINKTPAEIIAKLMQYGVLVTINESIDFETAQIVALDFGVEVLAEEEKPTLKEVEESGPLKPRTPVVAVMGHVDHGKTTLLDSIRNSQITKGESGGITQHIGAYQIDWQSKEGEKRQITFLDTPGHEAFISLRRRGAQLTDIIILVIAADDGVKPQTIEVINLAKEANIPIIVAINKVDLPQADPERVKRELSEHGLVPEEWGGETPMVNISALKGLGLKQLLDIVLLVADLKDLKANPSAQAVGTVIESQKDPKKGATATILIQNGTLKSGDNIVVGSTYGKVRFMENDRGRRLTEAGPGMPVLIAGLSEVPATGDTLMAVGSLSEAKELALDFARAKSVKSLKSLKNKGVLEIKKELERKKQKKLLLILKADVSGSLETMKELINRLSLPELTLEVVKSAVGDVSESDITLAQTLGALILGFRVNLNSALKKLAEQKNVHISLYKVIYDLENDLKELILSILPPILVEVEIGKAKVLQVFRKDKKATIIGVSVLEGKLLRGSKVKIIGKEIETEIASLRKEKTEVKEVEAGSEAGVGLPGNIGITAEDVLVAYTLKEEKRRI